MESYHGNCDTLGIGLQSTVVCMQHELTVCVQMVSMLSARGRLAHLGLGAPVIGFFSSCLMCISLNGMCSFVSVH